MDGCRTFLAKRGLCWVVGGTYLPHRKKRTRKNELNQSLSEMSEILPFAGCVCFQLTPEEANETLTYVLGKYDEVDLSLSGQPTS